MLKQLLELRPPRRTPEALPTIARVPRFEVGITIFLNPMPALRERAHDGMHGAANFACQTNFTKYRCGGIDGRFLKLKRSPLPPRSAAGSSTSATGDVHKHIIANQLHSRSFSNMAISSATGSNRRPVSCGARFRISCSKPAPALRPAEVACLRCRR